MHFPILTWFSHINCTLDDQPQNMNFTSLYLWVTQKISSQYEHFYYGIYNIEKKNFLADVYVSSALGGLKGLCHQLNGLKMVSLDRPWQGHQALAIKKIFTCLFYFPQAFEVLKCLIPNLFEITTSIMNVDSKWLSTFWRGFFPCLLLVSFHFPGFLLVGIFIFPYE
jgi:hypothetical protein